MHFYIFVTVLITSVRLEANIYSDKAGLFHTRIERIGRELLLQEWKEEEKPCLFGLINILEGVKNNTLWASWVWDSMQSPSGVLYGSKYQLGNFDECIETPWMKSHPELRTQYCLAEIKLSNKEVGGIVQEPYSSLNDYINSQDVVKFNTIVWGICVPESCHPQSSAKFVKSMFRDTYFENTLPETSFSVNFCQKAKDVTYSVTFYCFVLFVSISLIAVLISTAYCSLKKTECKMTIGLEVAKSLSIFENSSELYRTRPNETPVLNGIRCLTSFIIVLCHVWFIFTFTGYTNVLYIKKAIEEYKIYLFYHMEVAVDTFFVISGFLLMKSFITSKTLNPGKVIIKRYFRLVYPMAILIFGTVAIGDIFTSGPMKPDIIRRACELCEKSWWQNLLLINNYIDMENSCLLITWFIACDFHLTILGTLLFWLYKTHRRTAVVSYLAVTIASIVLPALATYNGQPLPLADFNIEIIRSEREKSIAVPTYVNTHYRATPYLIGYGFAFLINALNLIPRRKIFSKKLSMAGIVLVLVMFLSVIVASGLFYYREYNVAEHTLYSVLSKTIWALAVCLLIAICEYGDAPLVSDFLGSSVFVPLGKISYGLYLLHCTIIVAKHCTNRNIKQLDFIALILDAMGVTVLAYCLSVVLWLLVEAPMNNIVALVLRTKNSERSHHAHVNNSTKTGKQDALHCNHVTKTEKPKPLEAKKII